jgi:hypothetical protein
MDYKTFKKEMEVRDPNFRNLFEPEMKSLYSEYLKKGSLDNLNSLTVNQNEQNNAELLTHEQLNLIKVRVVDINMPFISMVEFMVKWSLASIPAFIILFVLFGILYAIFSAIIFNVR